VDGWPCLLCRMRLATLSQNGRAVIYLSLTWWSLLGKCLTLNCKLLRTNYLLGTYHVEHLSVNSTVLSTT